MKHFDSLTSSADPQRSMPAGVSDRLDRIDSALASLENEQRRLLQLGLETPLARCDQQIRYWRFLKGICSMSPEVEAECWEVSWPDVR